LPKDWREQKQKEGKGGERWKIEEEKKVFFVEFSYPDTAATSYGYTCVKRAVRPEMFWKSKQKVAKNNHIRIEHDLAFKNG
jgi:hypothetical protein